jgi:heavy metal sensor kinase
MSLTNRLLLFSLTTLAVVLAGFSVTLYLLARSHLYRQAEERLEAGLNTLTACVEVKPQGVEWDRGGRRMVFAGTAEGQFVWFVTDPEGEIIDRTEHLAAAILNEAADHLRSDPQSTKRLDWRGEHWLFRRQRIAVPDPPPAPSAREQQDETLYPALWLTVGLSLEPVWADLRQLAGALIGLSGATWVVALLLGRVVCRRALWPVSRMATAASGMDADQLDQRLPPADSGDELEDLSRAFNGLLDRLQESFDRQRRFTGEASHQLRTPLTAMLGQVEVALRRERPAEEYQRVLGSVRQQANRMKRIVEALLFLARADAEARLPERERLDLREWLKGHLVSWAEHPRGGDLVVDAAGEQAGVDVHPALLGELVNVLLDNACKYSPPGSPVTVRLRRAGSSVELSVRDQGPGIAAEDLPHLFTPFFRSAEARRRGIDGLGLGLAIVKRLADAFGATLQVESGLGQGSSFTLRLPLAEACR